MFKQPYFHLPHGGVRGVRCLKSYVSTFATHEALNSIVRCKLTLMQGGAVAEAGFLDLVRAQPRRADLLPNRNGLIFIYINRPYTRRGNEARVLDRVPEPRGAQLLQNRNRGTSKNVSLSSTRWMRGSLPQYFESYASSVSLKIKARFRPLLEPCMRQKAQHPVKLFPFPPAAVAQWLESLNGQELPTRNGLPSS